MTLTVNSGFLNTMTLLFPSFLSEIEPEVSYLYSSMLGRGVDLEWLSLHRDLDQHELTEVLNQHGNLPGSQSNQTGVFAIMSFGLFL